MNAQNHSLPISTISTQRSLKIALALIVSIFVWGCSTTAHRSELNIGGTKYSYVMQSCQPQIKWNGMSVSIEGLNVPSTADTKFSVGKIDFSEKAIREIKETVVYYNGLLDATCQTLVRLTSEDAVERYSLHRDQLLQGLVDTLSKIQAAPNEEKAVAAATEGKAAAKPIDTSKTKT